MISHVFSKDEVHAAEIVNHFHHCYRICNGKLHYYDGNEGELLVFVIFFKKMLFNSTE